MKRAVLLIVALVIYMGAVCWLALPQPSLSSAQDATPRPTGLPTMDQFVYLPIVHKPVDPLATLTAMPTPTNTPRPTALPTSTPTATLMLTETPTVTPTNSPTPTITPTPTNTPTATPLLIYNLLNGDFENGQDGSWIEQFDDSPRRWWPLLYRPLVNTFTVRMGEPYLSGHGSWLGWLGAADADPQTGGWEAITAIEQLVTVLQGMDLCFEYLVYSEDYWDNGGDTAKLLFDDAVLMSWDVIGLNSSTYWDEWHDVCVDVETWWGETVLLRFEMTNDHLWYGDFHIDNVEFKLTD